VRVGHRRFAPAQRGWLVPIFYDGKSYQDFHHHPLENHLLVGHFPAHIPLYQWVLFFHWIFTKWLNQPMYWYQPNEKIRTRWYQLFRWKNVNQMKVLVKSQWNKNSLVQNFSDGKCPTSQGFRNHTMEKHPLVGHFPAHILFTNGCYFSIGFLPNG
jgi:hypothetical protein